MQLRLPGGGSFLDAVFDSSPTGVPSGSNAFVDGVRPEQVTAALDALGAGHVEYVGLDDVTASIQVAEVPGGYLLQRTLDGGDVWIDQPAPLDLEQLRTAFQAFLAGDVDAGLGWPAVEDRPARKKSWFRRG